MSIERVEKIIKSFGGIIDYKDVRISIGNNSPRILIEIPITTNIKDIYGYLSAIYTLTSPTLAKKVKGTIVLNIYYKKHRIEKNQCKKEFDHIFETMFFDKSVGYIVTKELSLEKTPTIHWSREENVIVPYMGIRGDNEIYELNFTLIVSLLNEIGILDFSIDDVDKEYLRTLKVLKNYGNVFFKNINKLGIAVPKVNILDNVSRDVVVLEIRNFLNEIVDIVKAEKEGVVLSLMKGILWENYGNYVFAIAYSQ